KCKVQDKDVVVDDEDSLTKVREALAITDPGVSFKVKVSNKSAEGLKAAVTTNLEKIAVNAAMSKVTSK
ncbi:hypothetical protein HET73_07430, partial [Wolbachia endosymbiont of Atemnus politus]